MNFLFVGLGSIGQRHLRILKKINTKFKFSVYSKRKQINELNSKNKFISKNLLKKYNIKVFRNFNLACSSKPDAVFICNDSSKHEKYLKIANNYNLNIFVEKPITTNLKNLAKILKKNKSQKNIIYTGYQLKFNQSVILIKDLLRKKKIGKICGANLYNGENYRNFCKYKNIKKSYAVNKNKGGGSILTQIHEIDLANYFFGKPYSVYCSGNRKNRLNFDVETYSNFIINYQSKDNFPVNIVLEYFQLPPMRKVLIVGSEGAISWNYYSNKIKVNYYNKKKKNLIYKKKKLKRDQMFKDQLLFFIKTLNNKKNMRANLVNSFNSIVVAEALKKSMKNQKIVYIRNLNEKK